MAGGPKAHCRRHFVNSDGKRKRKRKKKKKKKKKQKKKKDALRVSPAVTRLTAYRRLQLSPPLPSPLPWPRHPGASGQERPELKKYRFLIKIKKKLNSFESLGVRERAARSGRD